MGRQQMGRWAGGQRGRPSRAIALGSPTFGLPICPSALLPKPSPPPVRRRFIPNEKTSPLSILLPLLVAFQTAHSDPPNVYHGRQNQLAVRLPRIEADITVDGNLTEPAWRDAAVLTGFSQYAPNDNIAAVDSTEVLVWYSPTAIHFGIRAFEPHGQVHATLANRDRIFADDNVQILLGTFNDGRQASVFMVNPLGVQADGSLFETGRVSEGFGGGGATAREPADLSPDFVFQSKGRLTDYGYEVEVRIPFKTLRYPPGQEQTWGINIVRQIQHSGF